MMSVITTAKRQVPSQLLRENQVYQTYRSRTSLNKAPTDHYRHPTAGVRLPTKSEMRQLLTLLVGIMT